MIGISSVIQKSVCISRQLAQGQAGLVSIRDWILVEGNVAFTWSKKFSDSSLFVKNNVY